MRNCILYEVQFVSMPSLPRHTRQDKTLKNNIESERDSGKGENICIEQICDVGEMFKLPKISFSHTCTGIFVIQTNYTRWELTWESERKYRSFDDQLEALGSKLERAKKEEMNAEKEVMYNNKCRKSWPKVNWFALIQSSSTPSSFSRSLLASPQKQ